MKIGEEARGCGGGCAQGGEGDGEAAGRSVKTTLSNVVLLLIYYFLKSQHA